jgi:hypothetical protein
MATPEICIVNDNDEKGLIRNIYNKVNVHYFLNKSLTCCATGSKILSIVFV